MDVEIDSDEIFDDEPEPDDILKLLPIFDNDDADAGGVATATATTGSETVAFILDWFNVDNGGDDCDDCDGGGGGDAVVVSGDFELLIRRKNFVSAFGFDFCCCCCCCCWWTENDDEDEAIPAAVPPPVLWLEAEYDDVESSAVDPADEPPNDDGVVDREL